MGRGLTAIGGTGKPEAPSNRLSWHYCGLCYFLDARHMCNYYPDQVEVHPERFGCVFWECVMCHGPYDEVDGRGALVDHVACLDGIIEVV